MTPSRLPAMPPGETINGRKLFSAAAMREFAHQHGRACFNLGRASVNPPFQSRPVESEVVHDLMGMMGMTK